MSQAKSLEKIFDEIHKEGLPEKVKKSKFEGTVKSFLEYVCEHPEVVETPQQRLNRAVFTGPGRRDVAAAFQAAWLPYPGVGENLSRCVPGSLRRNQDARSAVVERTLVGRRSTLLLFAGRRARRP